MSSHKSRTRISRTPGASSRKPSPSPQRLYPPPTLAASPHPVFTPQRESIPRAEKPLPNLPQGAKIPARIAVLGPTGVGKTTFINLASNSQLRVGVHLESCTDTVEESQPFDLDEYEVTLIDTPGFNDSNKSDADILNMICDYLSSEYAKGRYLTGVIYLHRISENRLSGSSLRNFRLFKEICGDDVLRNTAIVTNMWSTDGRERQIQESREEELRTNPEFFKDTIDAGSHLIRHANNTIESAHGVLRLLVENQPMPLLIQKELGEKNLIIQTTAGKSLLADVIALEQQYEEKLKEVEEEMREAERKNDLLSREELRGARAELEEAQAALERERRRLLPPPPGDFNPTTWIRLQRQRHPNGGIASQLGIRIAQGWEGVGQLCRKWLLPPSIPDTGFQRDDELW